MFIGYEKKITELPEEQKAIVEEQLEQYVNMGTREFIQKEERKEIYNKEI